MSTFNSIDDIQKLPSVLEVEKVSAYLVLLVTILNRDRIDSLKGAEAINDLISLQSHNESGLSVDASEYVLGWIKENYDSDNQHLVSYQAANLANLTCIEAESYLELLIEKATSGKEREELKGALSEIDI